MGQLNTHDGRAAGPHEPNTAELDAAGINPFTVALAQICTGADVHANAEKITRCTHEAARQGARLAVFPEASMVAFGNDLALTAAGEGAQFRRTMSELARTSGVHLLVGEFEVAEGSDPRTPGPEAEPGTEANTSHAAPEIPTRVRNVLAHYSPDGTRRTYQKIHLYDAYGYRESEGVEPGDTAVTTHIGDTALGLATCYDVRFPELFTTLARDGGAHVMIVSASWGAGPGKREQWDLLARARALDSTSFVIAVDQAAPEAVTGVASAPGGPTGVGHSVAVDPLGRILASCGAGEELAVVELDLSECVKARRALPVLDNARRVAIR